MHIVFMTAALGIDVKFVGLQTSIIECHGPWMTILKTMAMQVMQESTQHPQYFKLMHY